MSTSASRHEFVAALQTARAGSESVVRKNVLPVHGKPLFRWNLDYACAAERIHHVFCLTDIPEIHQAAAELGCGSIALPPELARGNHYDAIRFGLAEVEFALGFEVGVLVILLGNAAGALPSDLDGAIEMLLNDPALDSVCSVSEFNAFNPARAMRICPDGQLERMVGDLVGAGQASRKSNEKNFLGDVHFFNGSFWVCRRGPLIANSGPLAFPWLGARVAAWVQPPFMEVDAEWQLKYLRATDILGG